MTTPESAAPAAATPDEAAQDEAAQDEARRKMQGYFPRCPSRERFPVITGFITPGSDDPDCHSLDASVSMDVYDPTEFVGPGKFERIRVAEIDDDLLIEVNWCVCGSFAASICGCWELEFFLDDVGVGRSSGKLPLTGRVDVTSVKPVSGTNDDFTRRCYTFQGRVRANTVTEGAYSLLVIIKLLSGTCRKPGKPLGDYLGFAEIPVLVFVKGE
jgi:hypothetical protein